jgi:peptidoglycan/LPS O-acetylase OafA/YrhL
MKIPQLTFTRFLAAMAIVVFHFGRGLPPYNLPYIDNLITTSNTLVSYFFALSGFILVISSAKYLEASNVLNKGRFWLNRFARIYPLYIFALIMFLGLILNARTPREKAEFGRITANATLTQSWFPEYSASYNFPGWSLSVEALFYFLFPFLLMWLRKHTSKSVFWIAMGAWVANLAIQVFCIENQVNSRLSYYFPPFHVGTFLFGICIGIIFLRHYEQIYERRILLRWLAFISFALVIGIVAFDLPIVKYHHNGMFTPAFMLIIIGLALTRKGKKPLFAARPLEYLGEISYGIYILQAPVWVLVSGLVDRTVKWDKQATFYVYVLILIVFSAICYHLIEVPFRNKVRAWGERFLTPRAARAV